MDTRDPHAFVCVWREGGERERERESESEREREGESESARRAPSETVAHGLVAFRVVIVRWVAVLDAATTPPPR